MVEITSPICFLGDVAVGKTALIQRRNTGTFCVTQNTVTSDSYFITINEKKLKFIDTAGQEEFHSLISSFARDSQVLIIVFDITSKKSYKAAENYWFEYISDKCDPFSVLVAGNKSDLEEDRAIKFEDGVKLAEKFKDKFYSPIKENIRKNLKNFNNEIDNQRFTYFETSASNGNGVDFLFDTIANMAFLAQLTKNEHNSLQITQTPKIENNSRCACSK